MDGRADQYALACAAFELLAGAPPFERDQGMAVMWRTCPRRRRWRAAAGAVAGVD